MAALSDAQLTKAMQRIPGMNLDGEDERWRREKPSRFRGLKYKHGVPVIDDSHALRQTYNATRAAGGFEGKDAPEESGRWLLGASERDATSTAPFRDRR